MLEQYDALLSYFRSTGEKSASINRITAGLENPLSRPYLMFLCESLPVINIFNKLMQKQSPTIHILSREINTFIKKILLHFLSPSVVQSTSAANIDLDDASLYVPLDEVFVGDKASTYLTNDESDLTTSDVRRFQETCRKFWSTAAKYAISKLPLDNNLLKSLMWIHPHVRDYSKVSEVLILCASELVQVVKEEEKAKLREKYVDYCTSELPPHLTQTSTQEMPIDTYWHNIAHVKDDCGELKYQLL